MPFARPLAAFSTLVLLTTTTHAQDGGIKIEKFHHSAWTKGIFSEAVTVTGIGNARFIYLAGVGAEDENGPRGAIRHHGNLLEQCRYAYDKIKRVLAHHGADLNHVVKVTTYITDLRLPSPCRNASAKPGATSPSPPTRCSASAGSPIRRC